MAKESVGCTHDVRFKVPVTRVPYSSIVRVAVKEQAGGVDTGTGFLVVIDARYVIVTAGHCLTSKGVLEITWPNGNMHKIEKDMVDYHHEDPVDFGIILLKNEQVPDDVRTNMHITQLVQYAKGDEERHSLFISGYPKSVYMNSRKYGTDSADSQYAVHLTEPTSDPPGIRLLYTDPTSGGMSGGPVFYKIEKHIFVFGIHIQGFVKEPDRENFIKEAKKKKGSLRNHGTVQENDDKLKRYNMALLLTEDILNRMKSMAEKLPRKRRIPYKGLCKTRLGEVTKRQVLKRQVSKRRVSKRQLNKRLERSRSTSCMKDD